MSIVVPEHPTSAWMRLKSTERVMFPKVCSNLCFRLNPWPIHSLSAFRLTFTVPYRNLFHCYFLNFVSRVISFYLIARIFPAAFNTNILSSNVASSTLKDPPEAEYWSRTFLGERTTQF